MPAKDSLGDRTGPARGRIRTKIAELLADERCSQAVLDFLAATDGRPTGGRRSGQWDLGGGVLASTQIL